MKNYRWAMVMVGLIALLMIGSMVWASPPSSGPLVPPQATVGFDADKVDGFHAASSSADAATRANKLLAAGSNGKFPAGVLPLGQLDNRYVNDDRQETISAAAAGYVLAVTNTGTGPALRGYSASGNGVEGWSAVAGAGVYGYNAGGGYGVIGHSTNGSGVYAAGNDTSWTDSVGDLVLEGSHGEIFSTLDASMGLFSYGSVYIDLDDDDNNPYARFRIYNGTNNAVFTVDQSGNVWKRGTVSALVETESYGQRLLYAMESPEVWHEDFGTASLVKGVATVEIEPIFAETVNLKEPYHVFVTPLGNCGLYVAEKSATSFTVRALGEKTCNIDFDYRIVAKRLGYENVRMEAVAPDMLAKE